MEGRGNGIEGSSDRPYGRVGHHLRSNVYGLIAVFIALSGTALAANRAKPNTVLSSSIKNGQVKTADLADNAVTGPKVKNDSLTGADIAEASLDPSVIQSRVSGECASGSAMSKVAANGGVSCETTGGGTPSGAAGGALSGSYPNPALATDAVTSAGILDGTIASVDLGSNSVVGGLAGTLQDSTVTAYDLAAGAVTAPKLDPGIAFAGFSGRVTGLAATGGTQFGGPTAFTSTTATAADVTTLSPNLGLVASALAVDELDGSGVATPVGPNNTRFIILGTVNSTGVETDTAVACQISSVTTSCDSGGTSATIPAGSRLVLRIVTIDGGVVGDVGGSSLLFGFVARPA